MREPPVTVVQADLRRRWLLMTPLYIIAAAVVLLGIAASIAALALIFNLLRNSTPHYSDEIENFKYGSISTESASGIPYRIWRALPALFPTEFRGRSDYSAFGFLYENDADGRPRDLPIGVSRRTYRGVDVVWFNCATCHTGTVTATLPEPSTGELRTGRQIVPGMPSNNLDLYRFIHFLLSAGGDERLGPNRLIPAMEGAGGKLSWWENLTYRWYVIPLLREGLVLRRSRLLGLMDRQPPWGPGRVDTFNPYKLLLADFGSVPDAEAFGASDFPAIFDQGPRQGMHLHWDGNNTSLAERNISAAIGAGVTPDTLEAGGYQEIDRVAKWLLGLKPPASPYSPDPQAVERGQRIYMTACAACHGHMPLATAAPGAGYAFDGAKLGQVEPNESLGVDPGRLNSYTPALLAYQRAGFFDGRLRFEHFQKTNGYANQPLDGLWLRAPYLHNGSAPTLADLLEPPSRRPVAFVRGGDVLDPARGGFVAPPCDPRSPPPLAFCFDTRQPGNGNGGHRYGTDMPDAAKADLLAYLLTF
jgi:processive rubber oxygenase RoxA-like protein